MSTIICFLSIQITYTSLSPADTSSSSSSPKLSPSDPTAHHDLITTIVLVVFRPFLLLSSFSFSFSFSSSSSSPSSFSTSTAAAASATTAINMNDHPTSSFDASTVAGACMVVMLAFVVIVKRRGGYHREGYVNIATNKA
mmetsp:Transcript_41889/g.47401  ORF Transcript_41889/g.47401 Transcript_41889/m.47401 type:complete len:140 (+) Transcript_41889:141-560(+)